MSGPKKWKLSEAVVLLIDVGKNVNKNDSDGKNFLDKSKQCASRIIQRKIFSDAKDEFSLILIGSEETDNELDYPNINVLDNFLTSPNWKMLRKIGHLSATSVNNADWLDGLIVAINLLKTESECKNFEELKIVMISNFATPLRSKDQVDVVIESLKDLRINLVVIGPQNEDDDNNGSEDDSQESKIQKKGEAVIGRIVDETKGVMCGFQEAMLSLDHFPKFVGRAAAWNCDLEIASEVFIPITGFKKFAAKKFLTWKKRTLQKKAITQETVFFHGDEQEEKSEVINSYLLGRSVVPTAEEDKSSMALTTEKCFKVLGFAKKESIPRHLAMDGSVYYIAPRSGVESSKIAVTALVKGLLELERVPIVRKVYCKNAAPKVGALIPTCEHGCYFFYYVQLPFEEDKKLTVFPSLRRVQPSEDQMKAVDQLINDMDLSLLEEDEDPYSKLVDPSIENTYNSIILKALHPKAVLPTEPSETVKNLIKPKRELLENASSALEKIKEIFNLEEIEEKSNRKGAANFFKRNRTNGVADMEVEDVKDENMADTMAGFVQSKVTEIGTVDPEGNFLKLMELGESFSKLRDQMQIAIKKLFLTSRNAVGIQKPLSALSLLRKHCVTQDPLSYNQFIASLKDDLVEREHTEFWDQIVQDKLGLITHTEAEQSGVSTEDGEIFYQIKNSESFSENYEMEAEDLLDMMM